MTVPPRVHRCGRGAALSRREHPRRPGPPSEKEKEKDLVGPEVGPTSAFDSRAVSHRNARANLHFLGQPNTFLAHPHRPGPPALQHDGMQRHGW
jgi:hypothetical protein